MEWNYISEIYKTYKIPESKSISKKLMELNDNIFVKELISRLNFIIKQIRIVIDAEDTVINLEKIKQDVDIQCKNFKIDKYSMLNSFLHRKKIW